MIIVLGIAWFAFKRPTGHTPISGQATAPASPAQQPTAEVPRNAAPVGNAAGAMGAPESVKPPTKPSPAPAAAPTASTTGGERSVWHVVVYTYNYQKAAQQKAAELAQSYPQLEPQVFSPTGHAPYLVALGSGMSRQEAFARREAALAAGLPKDTYMQNYRK
jgi:hypothetical protein